MEAEVPWYRELCFSLLALVSGGFKEALTSQIFLCSGRQSSLCDRGRLGLVAEVFKVKEVFKVQGEARQYVGWGRTCVACIFLTQAILYTEPLLKMYTSDRKTGLGREGSRRSL